MDLGFDNDNRTYPTNGRSQWAYEYGSSANGFRDVVSRLFTDDSFVSRIKTIYSDYRDSGILTKEALIQVADYYSSEIDQSQRLNFMRWDILYTFVHQNPRVYGSYVSEVNYLKSYISQRMDWMDRKLNYIPKTTIQFDTTNISNIVIYTDENAIYFNNVSKPVNVTITNIEGKIIFSKLIKENISIPLLKGVYIITVSDSKRNITTLKRLVK
jgi:hypothetical protein